MTIQDTETYRALSNVLQTTFGKSSDQNKYVPHTHFLAMSVAADNLIQVKYMTTVNYGHDQVRMDLRQLHFNEGLEVIRAALKKASEAYKDFIEQKNDHSGIAPQPYVSKPKKTVTLKLLDNTVTDTYEIINVNAYNSKKSAYYRISAAVEIV